MDTKTPTKRPQGPAKRTSYAHYVVVALVLFAVVCDVARWVWHHFQLHPVQTAQWLFGACVVAIVVATIVLLKIQD